MDVDYRQEIFRLKLSKRFVKEGQVGLFFASAPRTVGISVEVNEKISYSFEDGDRIIIFKNGEVIFDNIVEYSGGTDGFVMPGISFTDLAFMKEDDEYTCLLGSDHVHTPFFRLAP